MVFFYYNYYELGYLVIAGWSLLSLSIILVLLAGYEFKMKGGHPEDESIVHTTILVDSGVYSVVRHPQYFGFILFIFGLVLMSQHWLSVTTGILGVTLFYFDIVKEEQMSIEKFGDEYREYMNKVPRLNIILGVIQLIKKDGKDK
jgi:protein-S-isoprenylcysteine O-methyltransferase Ste14